MSRCFAFLATFVSVLSSTAAQQPASGLQPGDEVSAWEPIHEAGPHAGTKACPVCTYLDAPVLIAFAKEIAEAKKLGKPLETIAAAHAKGKLKVVLVVVDGTEGDLRKLAKDELLKTLMLCRPDPDRKAKQLKSYKVDPEVSNTVYLYEDYKVTKTWAKRTPVVADELKTATDRYLPKH